MASRGIARHIIARGTSDGAGVRLRRSIGQTPEARVDPFLMLDEFGSDQPGDYIGGFPPHPHRGFETVTYMLAGRMRHEDHMGNRGELEPGGAQWMTAGSGIVHSEMPRQEEGLMRGFQLWLNLPAAEKMQPAAYRDIRPDEVPAAALPGGGRARVLAGSLALPGGTVTGVIGARSTEPLFADIHLGAGESLALPVPGHLAGFVYVYEGRLEVDGEALDVATAGVLGPGDELQLQAGAAGARALLVAGKPLEEPVAQYGPFVMNSPEEIEQALRDYRDGTLTGQRASADG